MPKAKGPNERYTNQEQVVLVKGDIDRPSKFVEDLNRKLAEGYTPLSIIKANYALMAFVTKKSRVKLAN